MLRKLTDSCHAMIDLGVILMIGIAFMGLMVVAFIIFEIRDQLGATGGAAISINNITTGFDDAVSLLLVAITIVILAIAISALLMLRQR